MSFSLLGGGSRRERKVRMSLLATVGGLGLLSLGALIVESRRETDLADPTQGVTASFKDSLGEAPPIRFVDVAAAAGLAMRHGPGARGRRLPEDTGSGAAWGDYDGDGDWDLYVVNFQPPTQASASDPAQEAGSNRLFRNEGGRFSDVTVEAGVGDLEGFGMGASFADYDGDGDVDLYVTNDGPNRLFQNRGDGTFEDVAEAAGVADASWSTGAAWGDFDRDGALDLYVCNYIHYDHESGDGELEMGSILVPFALNPNAYDPAPNRLYRNRGDGTFEDVAVSFAVDNRDGRSLAATMCDLDGDGWLDIYVNNDVSPNRLFRNLAGESPEAGVFQDDSLYTGTGDPRGSMGLSVGEIGGMDGEPDGLPDLFITHWVAQENALYESLRMPRGIVEYRDKTRRYRLGEVSIDQVGWGCGFVDLDLDGWLDIAVTNGSTLETNEDALLLRSEPLFLFWNAGTHFIEVASSAGDACAGRYWGRGLAAADYDQDGDLDLAVVVNRGQPLLLENRTETQNASLSVLLRGPAAVCFGARVELIADGRHQVRWYGADVSYLSMHAPEMVFGLGEARMADEVSVLWADGSRSRLEQLPPGRHAIAHGQ